MTTNKQTTTKVNSKMNLISIYQHFVLLCNIIFPNYLSSPFLRHPRLRWLGVTWTSSASFVTSLLIKPWRLGTEFEIGAMFIVLAYLHFDIPS
jgi:hypothetical protein